MIELQALAAEALVSVMKNIAHNGSGTAGKRWMRPLFRGCGGSWDARGNPMRQIVLLHDVLEGGTEEKGQIASIGRRKPLEQITMLPFTPYDRRARNFSGDRCVQVEF